MPSPLAPSARGSAARLWIRIALVALVYAWFFHRTLFGYFVYKWSGDGNWSHGWLIPVISLYFLWSRREELAQTPVRPSAAGAVALLAVMAAYFYCSWVTPILYVQGLCVPASIAALALMLGGWRVLRHAGFAIAYLLLAVPLPAETYVQLTMPLRQLASQLAGLALAVLPDVEVEVGNVVIDWVRLDTGAAGYLNIETACSGLRLMMSFAALGLAYAYLLHGPMWRRAVMVLCCAPIAILCNALRVVVTGLFWIYGRPEWGQGTPHMLLGVGTLFVALGLFWSVNGVMRRLWIEADEVTEP